MRYALIIFSIAATPALAVCPAGSDTFLSCTLSHGRKTLEVCADDIGARYSFGPTGGAPDLGIVVRHENLDYTPWPGIGNAIWESVVFRNGDFAYEVSGSVGRGPDATRGPDGQVIVTQGATVVATLICDADSVDFPWTEALSDGKQRAGLMLDPQTRTWVPMRD